MTFFETLISAFIRYRPIDAYFVCSLNHAYRSKAMPIIISIIAVSPIENHGASVRKIIAVITPPINITAPVVFICCGNRITIPIAIIATIKANRGGLINTIGYSEPTGVVGSC
ncbi:MAG: hypothetical protein GF309_11580 [Candidatus Lokiarchaeota archaeon]|nr:hypothetical protein [Candidatus Lokiarchaeota archaeon]